MRSRSPGSPQRGALGDGFPGGDDAGVGIDSNADGEHGGRSSGDRDRGSVTAEFAVVVPAVILLLALCLSAMQVATLQIRLQDAASLAARSVARGGGSPASALGLVRGASADIDRRGDLVCVRLAVDARVFGGIIPGVRLTAMSCSSRGAGAVGGRENESFGG